MAYNELNPEDVPQSLRINGETYGSRVTRRLQNGGQQKKGLSPLCCFLILAFILLWGVFFIALGINFFGSLNASLDLNQRLHQNLTTLTGVPQAAQMQTQVFSDSSMRSSSRSRRRGVSASYTIYTCTVAINGKPELFWIDYQKDPNAQAQLFAVCQMAANRSQLVTIMVTGKTGDISPRLIQRIEIVDNTRQ